MAYDPTTPHSLLSRGEAIAKHIGSVVVGLGHEGVLKLEQLVGLVPKPEPVAAAPVSEAEATQQQDPRIAAIIDLLNKAWPERIPSTDLVADTSDVILHLQDIAIDANDKLIAANTDIDTLKARVTELEGGLATAIAAGTAAAEKLAQAATDLAAKDATIATLETSVADLKKGPFPPPASTVIDDAAPVAAPEGAAVETTPGVVADVTETTQATPSRESPVT